MQHDTSPPPIAEPGARHQDGAPGAAAGAGHPTASVIDRARQDSVPLWKPIAAFTFIAMVLAGAVVLGAAPRGRMEAELARTAAALEGARRHVQLGRLRVGEPTRVLALPASLRPDAEVDLYAQSTGYVRQRPADIGDRVRKGDLLAELDVPLIDAELLRAQAAVAAALATREELAVRLDLARTSLERTRRAEAASAASAQEIDEREAAYRSLQAALDSADAEVRVRQADVGRLEQEQRFARITAPFDGTVVERGVDIGDYVEPGLGTSAKLLFRVADTTLLRALVDLPQAYAPSVQPGQAVQLTVRELPGRTFHGTVSRTAGALSGRTRTLRVEIAVPNADGALLANSYATATIEVVDATRSVIVPGSAVIVRADGAKIAVVDDEERIRYLPVTLGRDLGPEIEVSAGLKGDERIVVNLADELPEGTAVTALAPIAAKPK